METHVFQRNHEQSQIRACPERAVQKHANPFAKNTPRPISAGTSKYINECRKSTKRTVRLENQCGGEDRNVFWKTQDKNLIIKIYKKILERHILKKPFFLDLFDKVLNPILGKSIAFYFVKK